MHQFCQHAYIKCIINSRKSNLGNKWWKLWDSFYSCKSQENKKNKYKIMYFKCEHFCFCICVLLESPAHLLPLWPCLWCWHMKIPVPIILIHSSRYSLIQKGRHRVTCLGYGQTCDSSSTNCTFTLSIWPFKVGLLAQELGVFCIVGSSPWWQQ